MDVYTAKHTLATLKQRAWRRCRRHQHQYTSSDKVKAGWVQLWVLAERLEQEYSFRFFAMHGAGVIPVRGAQGLVHVVDHEEEPNLLRWVKPGSTWYPLSCPEEPPFAVRFVKPIQGVVVGCHRGGDGSMVELSIHDFWPQLKHEGLLHRRSFGYSPVDKFKRIRMGIDTHVRARQVGFNFTPA